MFNVSLKEILKQKSRADTKHGGEKKATYHDKNHQFTTVDRNGMKETIDGK